MKMKKTLVLIVTAALTIGTMAGCSQTTLNYSKEISNTAKWEATTSDTTGVINVDGQGIKEEVTFTATGYTAKDQSYVDMKFNNASGKIKIPELKEYLDGTTIYINKSYYEETYALNGLPVPAGLANIKEEYIGIDSASMGMDINKIRALVTQPDAMVNLGKVVFGDSDIDLPIVQNGREYTINLNGDQTVDLTSKAIKAVVNNLNNINSTFKLGLTSENIEQAKKSIKDEITPLKLSEIKVGLDGSTITSKEVFADNSYNSDFNMNLKVKDFGEVSLEMKSTSIKSDVKAIITPTSTLKMTQEEFNTLLAPADTNIEATSNVIAK